MKKTLLIIAFLSGLLAFGQTNEFYITDESWLGHQNPGSFSPEQIDAAKHAKESRPAKDDPEGNWGVVSEGFQLSIRLEKNSITNGEPIKAVVILRNVSDTNLQFMISYSGDPVVGITLMKGQQALKRINEQPGASFEDRVRGLQMGSFGMATCLSGTQWKFTFDLRTIFDLSASGDYKVQATKKIAKLNEHAEAEVASSEATFQIAPAKP
jgi:hypothetical protein